MLFSFVILHYKTWDDTIKCVESIKAIDYSCEIRIIIVDNCSDNGSYEKLADRYGDDSEIILIHNDENLGFARGNNKGYQVAKEIGSDYIAILNNDIILKSKDLILKTVNCYEEYRFAVLGPDIVSVVDGGHQNPANKMTTNIKLVKKRIRRFELLYILNKTPFYDLIRNTMFFSENKTNPMTKTDEYIVDCQLHGSFIVFSKLFIDNEKYAFCPDTFLYTEEPILCNYCIKKGYKIVYSPEIVVYHKEDSSTNAEYNNDKRKREFVFSNLIRSHKVYLKQLQENVNEW